MVKVLGARLHGDKLRRMSGSRANLDLGKAVKEGTELIRAYAQDSIIAGSVSGPGHVASQPGDPPNADTHELDQSIKTEYEPAKLLGRVVVEAEHGAPMEFGTSEIEPRPFMRPAAQAMRPKARGLIKATINRLNRGG